MLRKNMLEQPNFADWLSKYLKNKLFGQKLSLKSQPVSCRRHCRHRKKATLLPIAIKVALIVTSGAGVASSHGLI